MFAIHAFSLALALTPSAPEKPAASDRAREADASGIAWVHDDYTKAKADAIADGKLLAIDVWATWCHTCLSMKNFVLTQREMAPVSKELTFLALDSDKPENAPFFDKISVGALPTFLVVDPKSDAVVARWVGSGTAKQLAGFFAAADRE